MNITPDLIEAQHFLCRLDEEAEEQGIHAGEIREHLPESAERALQWADSYSRMGLALELAEHHGGLAAYAILGAAWSTSDNIAEHKDLLRLWLANATRTHLDAMMTRDDLAAHRSLPRRLTVWRGCYIVNPDGLSWTLDRDTACRFTSFERYRRPGDTPLLLRAEVDRDAIVYINDRREQEIVSTEAWNVAVLDGWFQAEVRRG